MSYHTRHEVLTGTEAVANEPMLPRMPIITHDLPRIRKLSLPLVASRKRHQRRTAIQGPHGIDCHEKSVKTHPTEKEQEPTMTDKPHPDQMEGDE